jgi:Spy/CpxP family protein refolding chaperone
MKHVAIVTLGLLLSTAALSAPAGDGAPRARSPMGPMGGHGMGSAMERDLFPPELILTNQIALGLTTEQIGSIKKQVGDTHSRVLDVQVDLHRVTEQLNAALDGPKVDESAVLALASQAMDLEKQVKTAHLTLMIRVKNILTPEQQDKARTLSPESVRRANRQDRPAAEAQPD